MTHNDTPHPPPQPGTRYERSDMSVGAVLKFGIGFAVFITAAHLLMLAMFFVLKETEPAPVTPLSPPKVQVSAPIVGPQLEVSPSANWEEMKVAQENLLRGSDAYGWISPQNGTVRIPIDRAIDLALQRGFPVRATTQTADVRSEK